MVNTGTLHADGTHTETREWLCGSCFDDAETARAAASAEAEAAFRAALADGSAFAQVRADIAELERVGDLAAYVEAAEFIDLMVAHLDIPVPEDLRAFADRHRRP